MFEGFDHGTFCTYVELCHVELCKLYCGYLFRYDKYFHVTVIFLLLLLDGSVFICRLAPCNMIKVYKWQFIITQNEIERRTSHSEGMCDNRYANQPGLCCSYHNRSKANVCYHLKLKETDWQRIRRFFHTNAFVI